MWEARGENCEWEVFSKATPLAGRSKLLGEQNPERLGVPPGTLASLLSSPSFDYMMLRTTGTLECQLRSRDGTNSNNQRPKRTPHGLASFEGFGSVFGCDLSVLGTRAPIGWCFFVNKICRLNYQLSPHSLPLQVW